MVERLFQPAQVCIEGLVGRGPQNAEAGVAESDDASKTLGIGHPFILRCLALKWLANPHAEAVAHTCQ